MPKPTPPPAPRVGLSRRVLTHPPLLPVRGGLTAFEFILAVTSVRLAWLAHVRASRPAAFAEGKAAIAAPITRLRDPHTRKETHERLAILAWERSGLAEIGSNTYQYAFDKLLAKSRPSAIAVEITRSALLTQSGLSRKGPNHA